MARSTFLSGAMTLILFWCIFLIQSSDGVLRDLGMRKVSVIDNLVKDEIILSIPGRTNDTIDQFDFLLDKCKAKIDSTIDQCQKCAEASCDQSSASEVVEQKKKKLHEELLPLLYEPLTKTVFNVKLIEKTIGKVLKVIGLKHTEKFLKKFGSVVKDLSGDLLKNAKNVVKDAGKALEKFGKKLVNLAEDVGKGLKKTISKLGKEAGRLGKKIGKALKDIGKDVGKAIKKLPKAIKKLTSKVGNFAKKAGKKIGKVVKKITRPVGKVVKKVGKGIKKVVRKIFGGWGKRSTRYRRLAQCASQCPSCQLVDSTDSNVLISNVCGANHADEQNRLLELVDKIQRAYNASVDETSKIVTKVEYDTDSLEGFSVFTDVHVTINTDHGNRRFKSPVSLDAFEMENFAASTAVKVFEYI